MDWSYLTLCTLNTNFSYTATILNIVAICVIMKTSSLSRNFKTLLLSLAVSDLGIGLLAQPMFVAYLAMDSRQANETNETYSVIYIMTLIPVNFFLFASLFSVTALCADRFLAIHLHLRYQELVTYKRIAIAVILIWVISALISLIRLFIPKNLMYVVWAERLKIMLSTPKYLWFNCPHVSCLTSIDSLNSTPYTAYKTFTGMKDNFVLFPHFTRSDTIKQYSGPTTDTHTHTHTNTLQIWL